jgi:alanyl-tRNA synthetase
MQSQDIRTKFLKYFQTQGHTIVPSSPVVPQDDPTLLFVNAGMNQFKDVFLGKDQRSYKRATTAQKCIRITGKHNDFENVGHTSRHLTLFEMLGNFSFGDYFKKDAINFAFDVSMHVFDIPLEKLWVSVYEEDEEAFEIWKKHLPANRIVRFGKKENFWEMGNTGPCGPCSELLYDRGSKYSDAKSPIHDVTGERYLEFWNCVFMQFNRDEKGILQSLPSPSIDTGAGLERVVSLKMGVDNVFHTDILRSLIAEQENLFHQKYDEKNVDLAPAFHVIADHIRMLSFSIADGAVPSNTDRGYVVRKVLRRAVRYGKSLGQNSPFLFRLVPRLVSLMGDDYPEIKKSQTHIQNILEQEEESFFKTLQRGGNLFNQITEKSHKKISGEEAFKLKDTYGLPIEEIIVLAKDAHLEIDLKRYEELENEAKERSRQAQKKESQILINNLFTDFIKTHPETPFVGYDHASIQTPIIAIVKDNQFVDTLKEGEEGLIVLKETPFYAESGGQIGDMGTLEKSGNSFEVMDTISPIRGIIAHIGKMKKGHFNKQDRVQATIDSERRKRIQSNHSATHLLHWALEKVLGSHIKQAGSLVTDQRLRFDFTHTKSLSLDETRQVEKMVNNKIRSNGAVSIYHKSFQEIEKQPHIKQFFQEKYSGTVRIVDMDFSKELCGGTHVKTLSEIGLFKIQKETSIAAGIRRIEAVVGENAENYVYEEEDLINTISSLMKVPSTKIENAITTILEENKALENTLKQNEKEKILSFVEKGLKQIEKMPRHSFLCLETPFDIKDFTYLADKIFEKEPKLALVLIGEKDQKIHVFIRLSDDLVDLGYSAQDLIKKIAPLIQGGGGGKKNQAQAGGSDLSKKKEVIETLKKSFLKP